MNFEWLKKLLKKKNLSNTNTSDISIIDTSFISVPNLSELSDENRLLVEKYLQELKYNDYESILKYSDDLLNKSNKEIEFFMVSLNQILKDISSVINKINKENYFKLLLSKEEIKQSVDEFYKIIDEAKLRLIALDTYIKKEELRKYDFLGLFGKAERLRYLTDKSKLLNERDRLKTTIKISSQHLLAIFKALKEEEILLNKMEMYIINSNIINTDYCDDQICKEYALDLSLKKRIIDKDNYYNDLYFLVKTCDHIYAINHGLCLNYVSDEKLKKMSSILEYKKLIPFLVSESRFIKKYSYDHRDDYKKIIEEINELIKKYETTSSSKWNINELEMTIRKYLTKATNYIIICKNYMNEDILKELKESLFHLNYFFNISEVRRENKDNNMTPLGKSLILGEYTSPIIHNELLNNFKKWDWDYNDEKKYYDNLSMELLKKVGILNLPVDDYKTIEKRKEKILNSLIESNKVHLLFDIYNEDFDNFNLKINGKNSTLKNDYKVDDYLFYIYNEYILNRNIDDIDYANNYLLDCSSKSINLEILYYLFKFLKIDDHVITKLFKEEYGFNNKMDKDLFKLLLFSYFKFLNKFDDDRIEIIPPMIYFNQSKIQNINSIKMNDNVEAIYLPTYMHLEKVIDNRDDESSIKYIFVKEKTLKEFKNKLYEKLNQAYSKNALGQYTMDLINESYNNFHLIKIVSIPNNTKCFELSKYLDQEIEKAKERQNVSSKKKVN